MPHLPVLRVVPLESVRRHEEVDPLRVERLVGRIEAEGVTILLTSLKTPPWDLGQFRSQGIEPTAYRVIGVKAAVGHRQAYDPIAKASFTVQTPGPCSSRLADFPYRRLRRPIYPLDAVPAVRKRSGQTA